MILNIKNCTSVLSTQGAYFQELPSGGVNFFCSNSKSSELKANTMAFKLLDCITNFEIDFNYKYKGKIKNWVCIVDLLFMENNLEEHLSIYLDENCNLIFEIKDSQQGFQSYMFAQINSDEPVSLHLKYDFMTFTVFKNYKEIFKIQLPYKIFYGFRIGLVAEKTNTNYQCFFDNISIDRGEICRS